MMLTSHIQQENDNTRDDHHVKDPNGDTPRDNLGFDLDLDLYLDLYNDDDILRGGMAQDMCGTTLTSQYRKRVRLCWIKIELT